MVDVRHRVTVMRFYISRLGLCCRRMGLPVLGIFVFPAIFRRLGLGGWAGDGFGVSVGMGFRGWRRGDGISWGWGDAPTLALPRRGRGYRFDGEGIEGAVGMRRAGGRGEYMVGNGGIWRRRWDGVYGWA